MKTGFDWIGTTYGSLVQVLSMVWLFGSTSVVGFLGRRWLRTPAPTDSIRITPRSDGGSLDRKREIAAGKRANRLQIRMQDCTSGRNLE